MKRSIVAAIALAVGSTAVAAGPDDNPRGFYLGGGVGNFNLDIDRVDQLDDAIGRLDDDDTGWKVFAGYRINPYLAVEGAYVDFGRPSDTFDADGTSGDFSAHLSGFSPQLLGIVPLGPVELSAKVGVYFTDIDLRADIDDPLDPDFDSNTSEENFMYGVGVGATFLERLNAKLEYEWIDLGAEKGNSLWATGTWRF
jgi:Outer membrane protein beta-barrel domain